MKESFNAKVNVFPDGWFFVDVPTKNSDPYQDQAKRGNIAITASVNESKWKTLLWGYGNGKYFITLPAKIRKKVDIKEGDQVSVQFKLRDS